MSAVGGRHLAWDGCFNVRDLGGLPTRDGHTTRRGAVVRADALPDLTAAGWAALRAHGVRTVIDLRNQDERGPDRAPRPDDITTVHLPLDGSEDRDFWETWENGPQFATPLYYRAHVERFPERSVAVLASIAEAEPGGVAFLSGEGTTAGDVIVATLAELDVEMALRDAGLTDHYLHALRRSLVPGSA